MIDGAFLFLGLVMVHVIADFYLQKSSWVKEKYAKGIRSKSLWLHSAVHTAGVFIVLLLFGVEFPPAIGAAALVMLSHAAINATLDAAKVRLQAGLGAFIVDQVLHVLLLLAIVLWLEETPWKNLMAGFSEHLEMWEAAVVLLAFLTAGRPLGFFIGLAVRPWAKSIEDTEDSHVLAHSTWIGYLERFAVVGLLLYDMPEGVGFLITAKSILRYGFEKKDGRDWLRSEYVLVGTLLSFSSAFIVGAAANFILELR
jgi:hypothetical protein